MARRPTVNVKRITKRSVKSYGYVRPNPGVRAIASINGKGSYTRRTVRSEMSGLSTAERRARAKRAVRNATRRKVRRLTTNTVTRGTDMRRKIRRRVQRNSWWGEPERHAVAARKGWKVRRRRKASKVVGKARKTKAVGRKTKVRKSSKRRKTGKKRLVSNRRRSPARRRVVRNRRRSPVRRRVVRNRRRSPVRRRVVRNRSPVRRRVVRNRRRSPVRHVMRNRKTSRRRVRRNGSKFRLFRRNGALASWLQTGGLIAFGVLSHKLAAGFLKNLLVSKATTAAALPSTDAQADGTAAASGLGFLPASLVPYAGTISGVVTAAMGVYVVGKTVKNQQSRQLIAGGMVASVLHSFAVDLLKKQAPSFAQQISGLGAADSSAARLSAMYGMGASIEPMYQPIGEYFSSGVNGLGLPSYEAQAGMGEYFSSGVGEYFSSGVNGLGEYGSNPDIMQAAAGYGAIDAGSNSNHIDPTSNLDRELSIAEAAAGVGSLGPMQAAAGLGNVSTVRASQTWIPGESNPQIWAGVRPVDRSQMATAMIPAGSLQSGGGQGIFG